MNCALIGLGMVAPTHVAALNDSDSVHLSGVLGRDATRARAFADAHGIAKVYGDLDALCADDALDFVILATPPDARRDYVERLSAAGLPVLMEKPIERRLSACAKIVRAFQDAQLTMGVVFQHRARAASQHLKQAIDAGTLGQITHAEIRVPWWRDQSYYDAPGRGTFARDGGGVLITQAIHTLDLALWLMGPVAEVQALLTTTAHHHMEAEDWAGGLLQFESGAVATLSATTSAYPGTAESIILHGTRAAARLDEGILHLHHLDGQVEMFGETASTGGGADPMAFTHAWHQTVIEDFAAALRDNRPPLAPGDEALHVHAVINALELASKSGARTKVTLP